MKTIKTTALVALMTAAIGLSAIAPSYAQPAPAAAQSQAEQRSNFRHDNRGPQRGGQMRGGDILNIERGAEAVEIALVRLSHRITLTAEQQPLFDTLKAAALVAATDFTTAAQALRSTDQTAPTPAQRLDSRIAIGTAHLAALESLQPAATAFFDSLTAEQTAQLTPQRPTRDGRPGFGKTQPQPTPAPAATN